MCKKKVAGDNDSLTTLLLSSSNTVNNDKNDIINKIEYSDRSINEIKGIKFPDDSDPNIVPCTNINPIIINKIEFCKNFFMIKSVLHPI